MRHETILLKNKNGLKSILKGQILAIFRENFKQKVIEKNKNICYNIDRK